MADGCGIRMEQVSYSIGGRSILRDFDLSLDPGVNRTILGVSGVGKTTILKLLLGLLKPDSGRIIIEEEDIATLSEGGLALARNHIAIVFQGGALFDSMTVGENVGYRMMEEGDLAEQEIDAIVREKLGFVGLEKAINLYPAELSGGMKKRVALARALVTEPEMVLFDEPTTGLDPIRKHAVHSLITDYQRKFGFTAVLVSHEIPDVFYISQRIAMIDAGRIEFAGTPEELQQSANPVVREFIDAARFEGNPSGNFNIGARVEVS